MTIDAEEYIKQTREPTNFFYSRVSTREQSQMRQIVPDCVAPENVYREVASGKDFKRPIYRDLVDNRLKDGDTLYVWSIDRFSRNLIDCLAEVKTLKERGIRLHFIDEGQTVEPHEDNPAKDLFFAQLTLFAEYARKMQRRAARQGVDQALAEDAEKRRINPNDPTIKYKGRRSVISDDVKLKVKALYQGGFTISNIARDVGYDRGTVRSILKQQGIYEK